MTRGDFRSSQAPHPRRRAMSPLAALTLGILTLGTLTIGAGTALQAQDLEQQDLGQGEAPGQTIPALPDQAETLDAEPEITPLPPESERNYIDAAQFRSAFEGRTIHVALGQMYYGAEYYMPGDRSVWIFNGGHCQLGHWTYQQRQFCFTYDASGPSCWRVFQNQGGTYFAESPDGLVLKVIEISDAPLSCSNDFVS
ncbi:MAG: hypothetical protein MRY63_13795 [Neomegalonema sp.]|nr:hypothetical protein [Neomegalonema sp.]